MSYSHTMKTSYFIYILSINKTFVKILTLFAKLINVCYNVDTPLQNNFGDQHNITASRYDHKE